MTALIVAIVVHRHVYIIRGTDKEKEEKAAKVEKETQETSKKRGSISIQRHSQHGDATATEHTTGVSTIVDLDVRAATFLDVATLRCLFVPQWQEEGVFWALQFLYYRSVALRD